jgi:methylphosphotriester-DNA--protein-cysteine methyltransferase
MVALNTLFGLEGEELTERIFNAGTFEEKIRIITRFLQLRIRHQQSRYAAVEHAIARIHSAKGRVDYTELLKDSYHSQRQFERNFKERAGFSLQSYLKIVRFEAVMEHFPHTRPLTDVALDYGYYDQSHFNNDFKKFSGLSPTQYLELLKDNYLI